MYLAIDIGGSKTLMAVFSENGEVIAEQKFPTNHDYRLFLEDIKRELTTLDLSQVVACCIAVPGVVDRQNGAVKRFGNLDWRDIPVAADIASHLGKKVLIENDCNLAALSEALLVKGKYDRAMYITLSTGIGAKLIVEGRISSDMADTEVGFMIFNHEGKLTEWEEFASGEALVKKYGKKASEIEDPAIWQVYAGDVATGLFQLISTWYPEVVIVGGGVGAHFEKFSDYLNQELSKYKSKMVENPPVIKASRPEEAVVYGCYDFIRQNP